MYTTKRESTIPQNLELEGGRLSSILRRFANNQNGQFRKGIEAQKVERPEWHRKHEGTHLTHLGIENVNTVGLNSFKNISFQPKLKVKEGT